MITKRSLRNSFGLLLLLLLIASCGKFRKIQRSTDWRLKYDAAIAYYEDGENYRANVLLEEILPIIRGTKEAEYGSFVFAQTYFNMRQYILSAHEFQEFVRIFGRSQYVQEARYMHANSLYNQSPDYNLDQSVTLQAISALQNYINDYPTSEEVRTAENQIQELQTKLELKAFENARLYHRLRRYKAALVVFKNFHRDFPDSELREEVFFMGIETMYEYARVSIQTKQEERFGSVIEQYQRFADKYPNSKFLEKASAYYKKSRDELAKFAGPNNNDA